MPLPSKLTSGGTVKQPSQASSYRPVSGHGMAMSSVPVSVHYARDIWLADLRAIVKCIEQDKAFKDEYRWQHYHEVLLWYLVRAQSTNDVSFTIGSQYSWDRETLKSTPESQPAGTPLNPQTGMSFVFFHVPNPV